MNRCAIQYGEDQLANRWKAVWVAVSWIVMIMSLAILLSLSGCNAVSGFGRDLQHISESVQQEIEKDSSAQEDMDTSSVKSSRGRAPKAYRW